MRQAEIRNGFPGDAPLEEEASLAGFWQKLTWRLFLLPDLIAHSESKLVQIGIDDP
jgi:hypothetical protein